MAATADVERSGSALLVEGPTKVYADGTRALDELELRVPAGAFLGLLGPNGLGRRR
jgi:ABC-type multidrug transport system ATPase subunit